MMGSKKKHKQEEEEEEKRREGGDPSTSDVLGRAREHLKALTGKPCESIVGFDRTDDGWRVRGVVVEMRRIPPTTDILAAYDVEIDQDGEMVKCQRVSRYWRSQAGSDDGFLEEDQ